jgi:hypothetical protein
LNRQDAKGAKEDEDRNLNRGDAENAEKGGRGDGSSDEVDE